MILNSPIISGSLTVTGNIITSGSITISGSIASASYASNAKLLDGLDSTVFTLTSSFNAQTASFTAFTASLNAFSASQNSFTASILAQTASLNSFSASILTFTGSASTRLGALESYTSSLNNKTSSFATTGSNAFIGTQTITGSVLQSGSFTSTGTLTAQTLVVQTITSSVVYSSGSNIFGNALNNTQTFTGSVLITGSLALAGNITSNGTAVILGSGTTNYLPKFTGTSTIGNSLIQDDGTNIGIGVTPSTYKLRVNGTGYYSGILYLENNSTGQSSALRFNYNTGNASSRTWQIASDYQAYGDFILQQSTTQTGTTWGSILYFSPTGAATFSSSVSATSGIFTNGSAAYALNATSNWTASVSNNPIITFGRAGNAVAGAIGYDDSQTAIYIGTTTAHNFIIKSGSTIAATFLNTGAATFSSSVQANGNLLMYGNDITFYGSAPRIVSAGYSYPIKIDGSSVLLNSASGGNVGIGTSSPGTSLDVVKSDNLTTAISRFYANNLSQWVEIWYAGLRQGGSGANTQMNIDSKGTSPLVLNGTNTTGGVLIGSTLGVTGVATFSANILANTKVLINSTDTTKTPLLLNAEGNYSASGNMTSGFAITNTSFGRALNMGIYESGAYGWIQSAYINNADTTFALALQPRGNNVLIGKTTNAGGKLQVSNGTVTFNVDHNASGPYLTGATDNNVSYRRLSYDASDHLFLISAAESLKITSAGRTLMGGPTLPIDDGSSKLQVSGDIRADYSSSIFLQINGGATGDYRKGFSGINQQTGVARGLHIFNYDLDSSQGIKFYGGTYAAKVRFGGFHNDGNFFINTTDTNDGYKFDCNGTGRFQNSLNGTNATFASYVVMGSLVANDPGSAYYGYTNRMGGSLGISGAIYTASSVTATTTVTARVGYTTAGNSTNPSYDDALIFNPSSNSTSIAKISVGNQYASDYGTALKFTLNPGSGPNLLVDVLTLRSTGNIGIGTNNPSEKLTVYGAVIRLEGAAGVSPFAIANNNSDGFRVYDYNGGVNRFIIPTTVGVTALGGYAMTAQNSTLYAQDGALSYYSTTNGVYLNGAGTYGWLRLQASGVENDRTAINLWGASSSQPDTISFKTAAIVRLTIGAGGGVGIGCIPSYSLDVKSSARILNDTGAYSITNFYVAADKSGSSAPDPYNIGGIRSQFVDSAWISAKTILLGSALTGYGNPTERISFLTDGTNLITSMSGRVCIGVTTPYGSNLLNVNGSIYSTGNIAAVVADNVDLFTFVSTSASYTKSCFVGSIAAAGSTSSYYFYGQQSTSVVSLKIFTNGNIQNTNNSYGAISDARLKENIIDATPKLEDLMKVKVRNYNLKGESNKQIGVISQELEEIFPNMIEESTNIGESVKIKGVKYSVFVPMLIKAIQEQQQQINELKQLINK